MQNKENLLLISDIPLLTWHLPNKEQDIIEEAENSLLKKDNNRSNSNKNENKENIPYRCNNAKSSSCPSDSEFTNPNEENSENRGKNVQQRHDYLSEDEITKIGERLNHSLRMRSSNNDSTASQKANYNLRERRKEINFIGVKNRNSTSSQQVQRKRATKRKLPSDFSEDSVCSKRGRKRLHTLTENSLEMGQSINNSSAQKLKCSFMEMETTLNEVNQLIVNWIKGICDPLERHEALTLLHTVQNIYETIRCKKQMIKVDKTLGKKKSLQQYVNKLLKDSEYLHEKLTDIINECDMKHLKFTESEKENEILLKSVSTKRPRSLKPTKKTTKNIKSILKTTNNHFKKSKKLSFSKKYINIYDDNTMSQRSLDSDQDMCLDEDSYISHSNDMDFEETDEVHEESIDVSYSNKVQDFNSEKKLLVNESCLKEDTQLSVVNERAELTPSTHIMEQNLLNKEINAFGDNISNQLLQNSSSSQTNNSENTKKPGKSLAFNLQDYLIDYDQSLSLPSSNSNLIQTEQSKLEMSPQQESAKLCDNTNKQSELLSIEQRQCNNINLQESSAIKSRNSTENKEKQINSNLNMNTVQIEKPERFNEKTELLTEEPLDTDGLKTPVIERNPNSGSMNVSQTYYQLAITNISENSSNVTVNNNTIFNTSNSQIQKQKYTNEETELLTQNSLATNSLNAPGPQINLIHSNQNVFENYNQPAIKDISENNSKLIFVNNNNTAVNANIFQKKYQERPKAEILPQDSFNTNSLKKTIHDLNTSHFDLNTTQLQNQELEETMDLHHQDSLSTDTLKPIRTQRNSNSSTYDLKSSINQPKKGKCFVKKQAGRKELVQQEINISNLEKNMSLDKGMFLCTQCTLHTQSGNSDAIINHEMNSEQNPNNSNNIKIKRSTNFKTYKRKRINKSISGEIGSEISQQKQIPLAINQNSNQFTLQKLAVDNSIYDKLIHLKNDSKIINASSEKMDMMETPSDLLLTEPSLSLSQPIKSIESTMKDVDSCENNNDQNLSTELKSPVIYVQNDPLFSPVGSIPNVNPQILNSEIKKISNNEQTISTNSNNNNAVINMNRTQMKNQEFQRCSENLLNSDTYTNSVQEKIQSSYCSEIIPATFEGIKSMRIKSKDEFVIIQDLHDLITADEFIW